MHVGGNEAPMLTCGYVVTDDVVIDRDGASLLCLYSRGNQALNRIADRFNA